MTKLQKRLLILCTIIFILSLSVGAFIYFGLQAKKGNIEVTFTLNSGTSKLTVAENLEKEGLIRSNLALKAYLFFHTDMNLQAGTYELNSNMTPVEMLEKISRGEVKNDSISVTLVEGRRLTEYVTSIAEKLKVTEEELLAKMENKEYLQKLIDKYWFITDEILNEELYYPLEGYIFPDTYQFLENSTTEEIIEKILDHLEQKLNPIKEQMTSSEYTPHQILSMAAIIELEAVSENDRNTVSQVIYKRLKKGQGLGMDVTTYYAVKKSMGAGLTLSDLKTNSPYNTSEMNSSMKGKLPVGPICNPSIMSINAVLNPSDTDYLYFYADIKTGIVYFTKTYEEHLAIQKEIG